jgi:hypothetical protein
MHEMEQAMTKVTHSTRSASRKSQSNKSTPALVDNMAEHDDWLCHQFETWRELDREAHALSFSSQQDEYHEVENKASAIATELLADAGNTPVSACIRLFFALYFIGHDVYLCDLPQRPIANEIAALFPHLPAILRKNVKPIVDGRMEDKTGIRVGEAIYGEDWEAGRPPQMRGGNAIIALATKRVIEIEAFQNATSKDSMGLVEHSRIEWQAVTNAALLAEAGTTIDAAMQAFLLERHLSALHASGAIPRAAGDLVKCAAVAADSIARYLITDMADILPRFFRSPGLTQAMANYHFAPSCFPIITASDD